MQFYKDLNGKLLPLLAWEVSMIKHIFRAQNLWWLLLKNQIFGIFRVLAMCSNLSGVDTPNYMFLWFLWVLCLKSRRFSTRTRKLVSRTHLKTQKRFSSASSKVSVGKIGTDSTSKGHIWAFDGQKRFNGMCRIIN